MAVRRMTHQAALLGQDDEVLVFEANIERNGLRDHRTGKRLLLGKLDRDAIARRNGILLRKAHLTVHGDGASLHKTRARGTRRTRILGP